MLNFFEKIVEFEKNVKFCQILAIWVNCERFFSGVSFFFLVIVDIVSIFCCSIILCQFLCHFL